MDDETIKSAFELAMERISALPDLTPEEIAAQKEKRYRPLGEALAARYLKGLLMEDEISGELDKYSAEQKRIVHSALVRTLCRAIRLEENPEMTRKVLAGIRLVVPAQASVLDQAAGQIEQIREEFEREKRVRSAEFESSESGRMAALGISGSAARLNLKENESWQAELNELRQFCELKLDAVRSALLQEIR